MVTTVLCLLASQAIHVQKASDRFICSNGLVKLTIQKSGSYSVEWPGGTSLRRLYSEAVIDGKWNVKVSNYPVHLSSAGDLRKVSDTLGRGIQLTIHHLAQGGPELEQQFWIYESKPEVFVRVDIRSDKPISSNSISPIVADSPVTLPKSSSLQSLFVPYDNDGYARFRSDAWKEASPSSEVGALYDDSSRSGIVIGSIDHDTWKSGVRMGNRGGPLNQGLRAFAGFTSSYTHDSQPHGSLSGKEIHSPRFSIGCYADWRTGMERYGELNGRVSPPVDWKGGVPFGWSSWSGHKTQLSAPDAAAATDFIKWQVPNLRSGGTAFINLDSFWDNLTKEQRQEFVRHAHSLGLKAGIYYTPFTAWGKLTDSVDGTKDTYDDIVLKDGHGNPLPRLDGGYPIDPTHPAALARIDRELATFVAEGYDFVKLDFLTHGALEGEHHNSQIHTGTQAYSLGMHHIVERLSPKVAGRPIFIALSIAPVFPSGLGHSRRISCDIFANIGATEYLLNSSAYGWWEGGRLYAFTDADSSSVYQPLGEPAVSMEESFSRLTASVITGGIAIDGDNLKDSQGRARVKQVFSHPEVLDLARKAISFRPVNADTGNRAGTLFQWLDTRSGDCYLAVFNVEKSAQRVVYVPPSRIGLRADGRWEVHDLWTGENSGFAGTLALILPPKTCRLIRLHHHR